MTDVHGKKDSKSTNNVNPIVAGIAGVVAGGVAVAAALVMSDKKNQKKVKDALADAKEKIGDYIDTVRSQPVIEKTTEKLNEVVSGVKQKIKRNE